MTADSDSLALEGVLDDGKPRQEFGAAQGALIPIVASQGVVNHCRALGRCLSQKEGFILMPAHPLASQLLAQCQKLAPCVLLIDEATLASLDPSDIAGAADYGRAIRILVLGAREDERTIQTIVRMGCMGFVEESAPMPLIRKAAKAITRGELWVNRRFTARIIQQLLCSLSSQKLTPREREILKLIAQGFKNRAIAEKLSISHETVRWHIRSLHSKLGVQDRLGTALYAQTYLNDEFTVPAKAPGPVTDAPPAVVPAGK